MTIRPARADDHARIVAVVDDWWGGRRMAPLLPALFLEHFATTSLVAEGDDGDLLGFLVGFHSADHDDEAYVHFLGVAPGARGSGLARTLHDRFAAERAADGVRLVRCVTSVVNQASVAFHTAIGFTVDAVDDPAGDASAALVHMSRPAPSTASAGRRFRPPPDPRPVDTPWPPVAWPPPGGTLLRGTWVELAASEPGRDAAGLFAALDDDRVWGYVAGRPRDVDVHAAAIASRVADPAWLPWTVRLRRPVGGLGVGDVVGTTSYLDVAPADARLEIGSTAYAPAVWGTTVNAECKLLLLAHAFEVVGVGRVQLKTDVRNLRSQQAIARLGARCEGTLRRYQRRADGSVRDTVLFSITVEDWPAVRDRLRDRLSVAGDPGLPVGTWGRRPAAAYPGGTVGTRPTAIDRARQTPVGADMPSTPDPAEGRRVHALDRAHVFHSWSAQAALDPLCIAGGEGSYVWDFDGTRYLDLSSQLVNVNIGHQHPKVVAAIQEQAGRLATVAPQHANDVRGEAARRIVDLAPAGMSKVFFTNGGADANENAVRMARIHTGRDKVLSFYRSYHGNTGAAIVATGDPRRWPNEYADGHVHFFGPYLYRSSFWATTPEEESERALQHLEQVITFEGPGTIAAILIETVVGTAGVLVPPPGYLAGVRELATRHGIVLILDEVMAGFGRTGAWFAFDHWGVKPDLITWAKGSNSGYVPVGGVVISDEIAATFDERVFPGGLTYSGHPLAAASIVASIDAMREERVVENAAAVGEDVLGPGLRELQERHPVIGEARGLGVFWALDLVKNRETREPLAPYGGSSPAMGQLVAECRKRGVLPFANFNRLHVVPPCTITAEEAKEGLAVLDEVFTLVDAHYEG